MGELRNQGLRVRVEIVGELCEWVVWHTYLCCSKTLRIKTTTQLSVAL